MHELALAKCLVELIEENARAHSLSSVRRARLRVGKMAFFDPDNVKYCFDSYGKNDLLKDIKLEIETVPVNLECRDCHHTWQDQRFDDDAFAHEIAHHPAQYQSPPCPKCGSAAAKLISGNEMQLAEIEGE
jgi:hydrogenase nickel incorporation protein HypA/HybF